MIVGRILDRAASFGGVPPPAPPPASALGTTDIVWWSRPNGAFNYVTGTDAGALGYPGIARATQLIAESLAAVPRHCYKQAAPVKPPLWITDPGGALTAPQGTGGTWTPFDFWSAVITCALLRGNAYVWLDRRQEDGTPQAPLHTINPTLVEVHSVGDQVVAYTVGGFEIPPYDMLHVRGRVVPGSVEGLGIVAQFRDQFTTMGALREYTGSTFSDGGVPAGILKSEAPDLTQAEADRMKARWIASHGGGKRSVAVLNATTTYEPLSISPDDAQFLETQRFSLLEQALMVGVPPSFIGAPSGDSMTYSNIESRMLEFTRLSLLPWARRCEDACERFLPYGTKMRFVLDGLYRADTYTRYLSHQLGLSGGWLTVDEVRAMENLPPLDEPKDEELR